MVPRTLPSLFDRRGGSLPLPHRTIGDFRRYFSVICRLHEGCPDNARNLLSLIRSEDLIHWEVVTDLLDYRQEDPGQVGFQYVDFLFDGEDLLYLCRTAFNGASNFHDSNYSTFHRLTDFRTL